MHDQPTPVASQATFEEIVLESIVFNPRMPNAVRTKATNALVDRLEARGVWMGCAAGCTCADCVAFDTARSA